MRGDVEQYREMLQFILFYELKNIIAIIIINNGAVQYVGVLFRDEQQKVYGNYV